MKLQHRADLDSALAQSDQSSIRLTYEALFTYHHALVQSRFATVGLYLAMNGFLAGAFFSEKATNAPPALLPALAMLLTALSWIMDKRTYHLLENVGNRGRRCEAILKLVPPIGFFELMAGPQDDPEVEEPWKKKIISHSFVIKWVHLAIFAFWIVLLCNKK